MLPKFKYLLLFLLGFLFVASPTFAAAPVATRSNDVKVRSEVQIRACQARQQVVKTRMENLLRLSSTMAEVFGNVQNRVEEFYQVKVVANGGSVSNYNELLVDMKQKKSDVESALMKATTNSNEFSCENTNPKDSLLNFRKDMQTVKSTLKDYRTSIRNFIVAVKTAAKSIPTPEPTGMIEK